MASLSDLLTFGGAGAATQAGQVQQQGALAGIPIQQQALAGAEQAISPFVGVGLGALGSRAALAGLATPEAQEAAFAQLGPESAGQRFIRDRQRRARERNAAALGQRGGGNIITARAEQEAGFAIQDIENQRRELAQLSAGGLAGGTTLGQLGAATAGNVAQLQQAAAQAQASGIIGRQQAKASGISDLAGVLTGIFG